MSVFRIERTIYNVLRTRESLMRSCKEFQIPTDWMLDSGILSKVCFTFSDLDQACVLRLNFRSNLS